MKLPTKKFTLLVVLMVLLVVLNILDILLTKEVLYYGGGEARELWGHFNVIGIQSIDYFLKIGASLLMVGVVFVQYWFSLRKNSKFGVIFSYVMLIGLNVFYLWVVIHNTQVLILQKQAWEDYQTWLTYQ